MKSDIEIAQNTDLKPIQEIAAAIDLAEDDLIPYGHHIAKVPLGVMNRLADQPDGRLILVTAMTPPPQGAGKTTTSIGLGQALAQLGRKAMVAIREPSLGPCFGMKGGAAGGGFSQVLPMEDINLHFTGDLHAVTITHNLCAALVDNHLHQQSDPQIHPRRIIWKRVIDMNDRTLRNTIVGLLDQGINGVIREDGFEITAASEIMAILCLADGLSDLKQRMGNVIVGYDNLRRPVTAREVGAHGAMTALLKNAVNPNLVQTTEGLPAFVHGGPFANIAHGCSTLIATRMAMKLSDFVVTEAGFGADLGAEKFFNIKCRVGGLPPSAAVLVAPKKAYDAHGIENVVKHVENIRAFRVPVVVSINKYADDHDDDLETFRAECRDRGIAAAITDCREGGGEGGLALAERILALCADPAPILQLSYPSEMPISEKITTIAHNIYGADRVEFAGAANKAIQKIEDLGYGALPVCMAKTPMSLTDDPKISGRPAGFTITVTNAKVAAGARFVVASTGKIMTMPGLPKRPAALDIDIDEGGRITGLF